MWDLVDVESADLRKLHASTRLLTHTVPIASRGHRVTVAFSCLPVPSQSQRPTPRPRGRTIMTDDSPFGSMLYDATGQAIYLFDAARHPTQVL